MGNRIIKESICTSEDLNKLSPMAEILFYRLIVKADDYGAYYGNVSIVKSNCFPLKSDDIKCEQVQSWLRELEDAGLIVAYTASDGRDYVQFCKWKNHQQVRAKKHKFPEFDNACNHLISNDIKCSPNPIQSNTESNPIENTTPNREYEQDGGFEAFWSAYPKKGGDIRQAYMEYLHALDLGANSALMIGAIREQTKNLKAEDFRYLPSPEKWLRNRGWETRTPVDNGESDTNNMFLQMLEERRQ